MNNREAQFILSGYRPGGQDAADLRFGDALAQARRDPALDGWFQDQLAFDRAIADRLQSVPPPADLRHNILAGVHVSARTRWPRPARIAALAAALVLLAALGALFLPRSAPLPEWQGKALAFLETAAPERLDVLSTNLDELQAWLRDRNAPTAEPVPAVLRDLEALGCKTLQAGGRAVSILCLHRADGGLVHLVITDNRGLPDVPPEREPRFARQGKWMTASWSEGGKAYMLVTQGEAADLESLLAGRPLVKVARVT